MIGYIDRTIGAFQLMPSEDFNEEFFVLEPEEP